MTSSPNSVRIDLSALAHNLKQVRKLIDQKTGIMGIVKSDAYGHGLSQVSKALEKNGVDFLGVGHLHEALELRKNGIKIPIAILCGIKSREESEAVVDKDLTPVVFDLATAALLAEEAAGKRKRVNIHLKIDTGMGRLGIPFSEAAFHMKKIMKYKELYLEALTSHLSTADEPDGEFTKNQIRDFQVAIDKGHAMGLELPLNNLANSAGVMAHTDSHFSMIRPGIMLYGGLPSPEFKPPLPLKSVMDLRGQVLRIKDIPDQIPVGYGRSYYTNGPKKISILSMGYGDGLPRSLSNSGKVLIKGEKVNIVGMVCMTMIACDITGIKDVMPGDEAVFLGTQGVKAITGEDLAKWSKTIPYEVLCSIGQRATKEYVQ